MSTMVVVLMMIVTVAAVLVMIRQGRLLRELVEREENTWKEFKGPNPKFKLAWPNFKPDPVIRAEIDKLKGEPKSQKVLDMAKEFYEANPDYEHKFERLPTPSGIDWEKRDE